MRSELERILEEASIDDSVKAVVLTGAGDAFCAGQDLNEVTTWTPQTPWVAEIKATYRRIIEFPKPVIAAVNGVGAGSGMQLALLCDYRVAAPYVRLGQTELRQGLATIVGTWLLSQVVGPQRARALALSGELLDVNRCLAEGLVDEIAESGTVLDRAIAQASMMASFEGQAFATSKLWAARHFFAGLWTVYDEAASAHAEVFEQGDSHRGVEAFLSAK